MSDLPDVPRADSGCDYTSEFLAQLGCSETASQEEIRQAIETRERWVAKFKMACVCNGRLTPEEIDELVRFEFYEPAQSMRDQVRRYVLKLKDLKSVDSAELMAIETDALMIKGFQTTDDVEVLCRVLYKYLGGAFVIWFEGSYYSVHNGKFGPVS